MECYGVYQPVFPIHRMPNRKRMPRFNMVINRRYPGEAFERIRCARENPRIMN